MLHPEKIILRSAGTLVALAAALEGASRLLDRPALHEAATWAMIAALYVMLLPIAGAAVYLGVAALVAKWKNRSSDRKR